MKLIAVFMMLSLAACSDGPVSLVNEGDIVGDAVPAPLTDSVASIEEGRGIFVERDRGHCILCHQVDGLDAPFQGNVGPDLTGLGARLTPGQIRLRLVDASRLNVDTVMPPYYRVHGMNQVAKEQAGKPVLTALEIEHLVAYLRSLEG